MTETTYTYTAPIIPSKWDIIPIHASDRASFKRCRRYWDWSSPARNNFVVRADIHGINMPMWFGTGIHYALEHYYHPILREDPVATWRTWFHIQVNGGVVTEEWLKLVYDLKPRYVPSEVYDTVHGPGPQESHTLYESDTWAVRGLRDILPDFNSEMFDEYYELGVQMMTFYKQYAEKNDDFTIIAAEHDFSVPIWDFENNKILTMIDVRENSPNYGKELEVHARGRIDKIYYRESTGRIGIVDHKTAIRIDEDYFRKLETDEQVTNYLWAGQVEANYYDLPYKGQPLEECIYDTLRKAYPKPPTELKNGMFSVARDSESTTYEMLVDFINRKMPGVHLSEKQQGYLNWLKEVGDEQFIIRKPVRRSQHQIASFGKRIYLEALDMLAAPRIYPNISNDFLCLNCQFRTPCLASEDGSDVDTIIASSYTSNKDR